MLMDTRDANAAFGNQSQVEDIRDKLSRLQNRLKEKKGVSISVNEQNDFVRTSIKELQSMDPEAQRNA